MSPTTNSLHQNVTNQLLENTRRRNRDLTQINIQFFMQQRMQNRVIRNEGYIDRIKKLENTRILILNLKGLRCSNDNKIQILINKL